MHVYVFGISVAVSVYFAALFLCCSLPALYKQAELPELLSLDKLTLNHEFMLPLQLP